MSGNRRGGSLGTLSALLFNLSLFAMPFAAANAWQALQDPSVYGYDITEPAKIKTRRALEDAAASVMPENANRKAYWSSLIQREIDEGDFVAARGFLLSARAMLPPEDAVRLEAQLPPKADDAARGKIALVFLDDAVRRQYEAGASPLVSAAPAADFSVLGDMRDIAIQSARWISGDPVDSFILSLSGAALSNAAPTASLTPSPVSAGASVVKIAKRNGKLSGPYASHIEKLVYGALPPQKLKQELAKAFTDPRNAGNEPAAVAKAFQASVDPPAFKALEAELGEIKLIADKVGPAGAVQLIAHAQDATDLKRLRLIAESGAERGVAVAKRAGGIKLLRAATGTLKMTSQLTLDFAALGLAVFGFVLSVIATLWQVLLAEWRHGHEEEADDEEEEYA